MTDTPPDPAPGTASNVDGVLPEHVHGVPAALERREEDPHEDLDRLASVERSWLADNTARVFTPANVVLALLLLVARSSTGSWQAGFRWWLAAVVFVVAVPFFLYRVAFRLGLIDDLEVVRREQRPRLFVMAALCVGIGIGLLVALGAPRQLVAVVVAMLAGLVAMLIITLRWKASMHLAVCAGAIAVLASEGSAGAWFGIVLLPAVGWARVRAGRHTITQVMAGAAVGALTAATVYSVAR